MAAYSYDIEVFGQSFRVRSEKSEQEVRRVAAYVDQQMRAWAKAGNTVIPLRVAIMAALGIAETLFEHKQRWEHDRQSAGRVFDA